MKAVIHKTGAIGEVLGIERRDDGIDYVYFENGLCKPVSEVGFLNPYEQYLEDCDDWSSFRREAAKDILANIAGQLVNDDTTNTVDDFDPEFYAKVAVEWANALISKLKEK